MRFWAQRKMCARSSIGRASIGHRAFRLGRATTVLATWFSMGGVGEKMPVSSGDVGMVEGRGRVEENLNENSSQGRHSEFFT